jgi:hypothetical protein
MKTNATLSLLSLSVVLVVCTQAGCLALNIPSQRHHDPQDSGGIFGEWRKPAYPGRLVKEILVGSDGECDGGCGTGADGECFEGEYYGATSTQPVEVPSVPWPQYHPVPTRPVFGEAVQ